MKKFIKEVFSQNLNKHFHFVSIYNRPIQIFIQVQGENPTPGICFKSISSKKIPDEEYTRNGANWKPIGSQLKRETYEK